MMYDYIRIVKLIIAIALNWRMFTLFCEEMGSEDQSQVICTTVRWLPRGKVVSKPVV